MQLGSNGCYLVLHGGSPTGRRFEVVSSLAEGLVEWTATSRISPIWPFNLPNRGRDGAVFGGETKLIFCGPYQTALLSAAIPLVHAESVRGLWASAGCFNTVLCLDRSPEGVKLSQDITAYFQQAKVPYESFDLIDGVIGEIHQWVAPAGKENAVLRRLAAFSKSHDHPALRPLFEENLVATATALTRAATIYPPMLRDLTAIADTMCSIMEIFEAQQLTLLDMQSRLLSMNAALSRFTSQAFSGIPPILETECHFWIHSLLGTGSANIALANLVKSIQLVLGEARIPERLANLANFRDNVPSLDDLTGGSKMLTGDLLNSVVPNAGKVPNIVPLITYFSGRDGFSSHLQTLSAPLTTVAECNSYRSNLLTVTHEISHIFVQSALSEIAPTPNNQPEMTEARRLIKPGFRAQNYLEAVRQLFLEGVIRIEYVENSDLSNDDVYERLPDFLLRNRQEVQEILVHSFDFLYFHSSEPDYYVRSIWNSWCAIPGIADRIPDYLMRTLCAVAANLLDQKPDKQFDAAVKEVGEILSKLESQIDIENNYVSQALSFLRKIKDDAAVRPLFEKQFHARICLVRLVRTFLFSENLSAKLFADPHVRGGRRSYGAKKNLVYDTSPIGNSLQFLRSQLKNSPTEAESLWVLHCLAFDSSN